MQSRFHHCYGRGPKSFIWITQTWAKPAKEIHQERRSSTLSSLYPNICQHLWESSMNSPSATSKSSIRWYLNKLICINWSNGLWLGTTSVLYKFIYIVLFIYENMKTGKNSSLFSICKTLMIEWTDYCIVLCHWQLSKKFLVFIGRISFWCYNEYTSFSHQTGFGKSIF